MRYALIVGPVIAAACALLSVFVVLRGMAMISEGVAHAGVGGLAVALLAGFFASALDTPLWQQVITCIFCTITALLIGYVTQSKKVSEDSAIGIYLTATLALGALLLSVRHQLHGHGSVPPSVEDVLFGSVASTTPTDVYVTLTIAAIIFSIVFSMYHAFIYTALDEDMARINGVPVRLINILLMVMVSVQVVVAGRVVGLLMVNALMIIPGATARMISGSFGRVLLASLMIGIGGVGGSLLLVILIGTIPALMGCPPGPVIVLTQCLIFGVVWIVRHKVRYKVTGVELAAPAAGAVARQSV
jgi:ABC-type Mn2+/Zn2+ transport system permease subunit